MNKWQDWRSWLAAAPVTSFVMWLSTKTERMVRGIAISSILFCAILIGNFSWVPYEQQPMNNNSHEQSLCQRLAISPKIQIVKAAFDVPPKP